MKKARIHYIDNIKVFLTMLVVAHHAAQPYGPTGGMWVMDDPANTNWLGNFFFINASFMMGFYFFVSGYFMMFSIDRKSTADFIKDRLKRLGIPLLIFTFLIFLPFNYLGNGGKGNLFSFFYDSYFHKPPMAVGHLWFVASLLAYSFIYLLLRKILTPADNNFSKPLQIIPVLIYIILLAVVSGLVRTVYPIDKWETWIIPVEVGHIPQYASLFMLGTICKKQNWLENLQARNGILFFTIAAIVYLLNFYLPDTLRSFWFTNALVESFLCIGISLGLLVLFKKFFNGQTRLSQILSENAYGVYLVHIFIVIAFQLLILPWQLPATIKFLLVTLASIAASYLFTFLLRKSKLVRAIV